MKFRNEKIRITNFGRACSPSAPRTARRAVPTLIATCALCVTVIGCGQPEPTVRRYTEVSVPPPMTAKPELSAMPSIGNRQSAIGNAPLAWDKPEDWDELPASGMRLAAFTVGGAECTIISLPGNVGGLEANIERWAGQIGAPATHEALHPFMDSAEPFETTAGDAGQLFDFQKLSFETEQSILAGIIKIGQMTVFVKMTGTPDTLNAERDKLLTLCQSIQKK